MKNLILVSLLSFSIMPVFAVLPPDASIIQVHDMQMINQQRFRIEEINDYNDVETEKARPLVKKLFHKKKFVEENGQIKIENDEN